MSDNIFKRIEALKPKAKELFLKKIEETLSKKNSQSNINKRIVAYIKTDSNFSLDNLKVNLKKNLPNYMLPSQFVIVDEIPLLPNGKIDRSNIIKKDLKAYNYSKSNSVKENNSIQKKLIEIWEEVLGFSPINISDNFFEIGGDSILSIQITAKARKEGILLKPNDLFNYQTIAELTKSTSLQNLDKNNIETTLIKVWEDVLGFSPINTTDNFFEIGGDSILSIQIIAKARKKGILLKPNDLFNYQTIADLSKSTKLQNLDKNNIETTLIKVWEDVLGFSPINATDNFFEIGGDSILSIQIIAKARKEGILLKPNDLFKHQTIEELKFFAESKIEDTSKEFLEGNVLLTPIQHWFFNEHKNSPNYWNQGIRLDNISKLTKKEITKVCNYIIEQHDALRASFSYSNNVWVQNILRSDKIIALEFIESSSELSEKVIQDKIKEIQSKFDLNQGSLFKCVYFNTEKESNFCILISHHLVIDAVSWQIIVDDFTTAVNTVANGEEIKKEQKTSSIKSWTTYLTNYSKNIKLEEITFWKNQTKPILSLPVDKNSQKTIEEKDIIEQYFSFSKNETKYLINANKIYNTKTEELLITAFVDIIGEWSNNSKISIGFERHGRETANSNLDLSKTVGWLTAYFPLQFSYKKENSLDNKIISTKEKLRKIPNGGIGFGALRYLKNTFNDFKYPEIVFNFLGTQKKDDFLLKKTVLSKNLRASNSERNYKLEINLGINDGILKGSFSFSNAIYDTKTISNLVEKFKQKIISISNFCNTNNKIKYTPSDFTEIDISQNDLDNLLDVLEE